MHRQRLQVRILGARRGIEQPAEVQVQPEHDGRTAETDAERAVCHEGFNACTDRDGEREHGHRGDDDRYDTGGQL